MSKEKREKRKLERKQRKENRNLAFKEFISAVESAQNIDIDKSMSYKDKFNEVWPFIKPSLEFAAILGITGKKFDNTTNEIITIGNNIVNNYSESKKTEFIRKLSNIWDKIESALEIAKFIGNDNQDELIDKMIEFGEWALDKEE